MTTALAAAPSRPSRLLRGLADLAIGGLFCAHPVTSVLALGWIARATAGSERPGWLLGQRGSGATGRLIGGLAANVRTGTVTLAGLLLWTLPFSLTWAWAWWAGWENSFGKGYEQAAIGPTTFLAGLALSWPLLTLLPFALAHGTIERRLGAFLEVRRILWLTRAAGWRALWLALLSVAAALPLLGFTALPVFIEQLVPGFAAGPIEAQIAIGAQVDLAAATYAFAALWMLRRYGTRVTRAARKPARLAPLWLVLSTAVWAALPVLILIGQFMNYAGHRWVTHPLYLLPWPG